MVLFHTQPLLPYCPTVWNLMFPPQHINTTLTPDSSFLTNISVVSNDSWNALQPLPPHPTPSFSLLLYTHMVCSLAPLCPLPYTSLVPLCQLLYAYVLLAMDSAMCLEWLYWVKENLNIIVIHTNTIIIQQWIVCTPKKKKKKKLQRSKYQRSVQVGHWWPSGS